MKPRSRVTNLQKLTLAQMPDSWVFHRLANLTETIEKTVCSVHGVLDSAIIAKRDEYRNEALRRLAS